MTGDSSRQLSSKRYRSTICQPDGLTREMYWLLRAHIRDVAKRLPSLIQSTDYYPLLMFHVGTSDRTRSSMRRIKDYRALGVALRDSRVQVVFSSILPVKGKRFEKAGRIWQINKLLPDWCHSQKLVYLNHGTYCETWSPGRLIRSICQRGEERLRS